MDAAIAMTGGAARDCPLCPRLVAYREALRQAHPDWWNAPVPARGDPDPWLVICGLAPGRTGANRTGRAFVGDDSGRFLLAALRRAGLASEDEALAPGILIVNAVQCVPPQNKPLPAEIAACAWAHLNPGLAAMKRLRVIVALGRIAHDAILRGHGVRPSRHPFAHGTEHCLAGGRTLIDSYHCSRLNQNTRRLTPQMLESALTRALAVTS